MDSKEAWKKWGDIDPYYGVLVDKDYRKESLSVNKKAFFESGENHVKRVFDFFPERQDNFQSILDFGCGTGRLLIPFARKAKKAVGLDISEGMIAETKRNAVEYGLSNIDIYSDVDEIPVDVRFDLIHSVIVFQHIPPNIGMEIVQKLLRRVNKTGSFYLHFNTGYSRPLTKITSKIKQTFPVIQYGINILRNRKWNEPPMQMYPYSEVGLIELMKSEGFEVEVAGRPNTKEYEQINLIGTRIK